MTYHFNIEAFAIYKNESNGNKHIRVTENQLQVHKLMNESINTGKEKLLT